ncbi:actin-related protein 2/3 complex subunit 2B isoform X1 [Senna tora]|uniref:Arp2/3 complex 34 kDa subunit n=1 Tax=Senna tora TaxID=362788 RepID=A0A834SQG1_9FABA|nr:actin-related protein 2/3 complex subunit 2B isoform X1 [Senna tora]
MMTWHDTSPWRLIIIFRLNHANLNSYIYQHFHEVGGQETNWNFSIASKCNLYNELGTPATTESVIEESSPFSKYIIKVIFSFWVSTVEHKEDEKLKRSKRLNNNFTNNSKTKNHVKIIREISTVESVVLSSQLKEILQNVNSHDTVKGMYKPIKLFYHPREPFFVIRQPQRIVAVFPIRFREKTDVIIATTFFQELMEVGSSDKWAKAPRLSWSAIPPPELRGEALEDLSTNGGFVSFDISSHHIEGKRLDKTVWNLLNFNAYVRYHVKSTKGFIQRRMRKKLESLVEVLHHTSSEENEENKKRQGCRYMKKLVRTSKYDILKRRCGNFSRQVKRIRFRLKIHGFGRFRHRWLKIPKFSSKGYTKLE